MHSQTALSFRPVVRFDLPDGGRLGRGKIRLLELIGETGSISAAGRAMDMSYRRAWLLVSAVNAMFVEDSVVSKRGGRQGGGAVLTPFGRDLIARFHVMEQTLLTAVAPDLRWLEERRAAAIGLTDPAPRS